MPKTADKVLVIEHDDTEWLIDVATGFDASRPSLVVYGGEHVIACVKAWDRVYWREAAAPKNAERRAQMQAETAVYETAVEAAEEAAKIGLRHGAIGPDGRRAQSIARAFVQAGWKR